MPCPLCPVPCFGAIAQLGERLPCTQEVGSSILPGSTNGSESQALKASGKSLERFATGEAKSSLKIRLDRGRRLVGRKSGWMRNERQHITPRVFGVIWSSE